MRPTRLHTIRGSAIPGWIVLLIFWSIQASSAQDPVTLTGSTSGNFYGWAGAMSSDYAVIGDPGIDDFAGGAYVFERQEDGSWIETAILKDSEAEAEELFGVSLSLSGNRLLVGARSDNEKAFSAGAAFIFDRQPDGAWVESAKLTSSNAAEEDFFGYSVSLSGDRALVGVYEGEVNGVFAGTAIIFERQPDGTWLEVATLAASDGMEYDGFGEAVSLDGDRALIGASCANGEVGKAYIFERQEDGSWLEVDMLVPNTSAGDAYFFGQAVSLQGNRALLGAPNDGTSDGAAFIFDRQPDGSWAESQRLTDLSMPDGALLGTSVSLQDDLAIIGVPNEDGNGFVLLFERQPSGDWVKQDQLSAPVMGSSDAFGVAIAQSGHHLLVTDVGNGAHVYDIEAYVTSTEPTPASFLTDASLNQNYPNPFASQTTISFSLQAEAQVSLIVYDLLGREVERLFNGYKGPGIHEAIFNAAGLPSGLYVYLLETPTERISRKMLLR